MKSTIAVLVSFILMLCHASFANENEVSLFSSKGNPTAYVAVEEEMTVYLWNGKPVAYLIPDGAAVGFHVYGFNGKHLGWFVNGVIWDKNGEGSCAVKEQLQSTKFEPFKTFKEFKPFKAFKGFAPPRPAFSNKFGHISCGLLLAEGDE